MNKPVYTMIQTEKREIKVLDVKIMDHSCSWTSLVALHTCVIYDLCRQEKRIHFQYSTEYE